MIVLALASYNVATSRLVLFSGAQAKFLQALGYVTLTIVLAGLGISGYGAIRLLSIQRNDEGGPSLIGVFSRLVTTRRYSAVLLSCTILYAIFFSLVSSILVFQPTVVFSRDYGVEVPSISVVTCCGSIGQVPQFVVYLTDHVGLLLVPVNLVIMFVVSILVGFNAGMARLAYDAKGLVSRKGWVGLLGAGVGLFTACPTCAGFFLSSLLGISGAFSVALGISWLQTALIFGGLVSLMAGPVLTARKLISQNSCELPRK